MSYLKEKQTGDGNNFLTDAISVRTTCLAIFVGFISFDFLVFLSSPLSSSGRLWFCAVGKRQVGASLRGKTLVFQPLVQGRPIPTVPGSHRTPARGSTAVQGLSCHVYFFIALIVADVT